MAELAIGAISLGIQVCEGLVKYCRAVSKRSRDIDDITAQIQALESTFRALDSVLPRAALLPSSDKAVVASAIACVESCEGGVRELQKFLDSISDSTQNGDVKGKMRDVGRKLAFGFRQDEVASLQQKVQGLATTAGNALQTLNMDLSLNNGEGITNLSSTMTSQLSLVRTGMASTSTAVLTAVDTTRRDTSMGLSLVSQSMRSVDNRIASLEKLVTSHIELTRDIVPSQGLSQVPAVQLLARPSMLREACDSVKFSSAGVLGTGPSRQQRLVSSRCGCDLRERSTAVVRTNVFAGSTILSNDYEETSRHLPNCPLYTKSKAQRRVTARLAVNIWARLPVLVQTSLACTTGAGGLSISPQLSFRMIVGRDSPAANAIFEVFSLPNPPSESGLANGFAMAERKILNLFRTGEASPHDQFEDGSNILFLLIHVCRILELCPEGLSSVLHLVETLVGAGVSCDEVDVGQSGPINEVLYNYWYEQRLSQEVKLQQVELTQGLARLSGDALTMNPTSFAGKSVHTILEIPEIGQYLDLSPLAMAILNKSEENVRLIISKYPHSICERVYGTTMLQLSCRWPVGLSILLSAGAVDLVDEPVGNSYYQHTAVDSAIYFNCVEAVALLFDAGCTWNGFNPELYPSMASLRCVRLIASKLADRRRHLLHLAEETLAPSQLSDIHGGSGVLDANALQVVALLSDAAVDLPAYLSVPDGYETIYLSGGLDVTYFPIFYEHGFHDTNCTTGLHYRPIEVARWGVYSWSDEELIKDLFTSDLVERLENYGFLDIAPADMQPSETNFSATGHHILASRLERHGQPAPVRQNACTYMKLRPPLAAAQDILACQIADCCRCACSSAGCLPLTINLKITAIQASISAQQLLLSGAVWDDMAGEILRFLTFEALEMTHTCCTYHHYYRSNTAHQGGAWIRTLQAFRGSVDEIQDEEAELHVLLEKLLPEFDAELAESGEGLGDFVCGYWGRRMSEECVPVRGEDQAALVELGVKLDEEYKTPRRLQALLGWDFHLGGGVRTGM